MFGPNKKSADLTAAEDYQALYTKITVEIKI